MSNKNEPQEGFPSLTGSSRLVQIKITIKGVLHLLPQKAPKLACFVLYLKITNIFLKNDIYIL